MRSNNTPGPLGLLQQPLRRRSLLLAVPGLALLAACGGGSKSSSGGSSGESVTVQLDWTPNTNHSGIYLALAKGWYKDAGLKVDVLPYTDANPDVIVANGKADIGVSFPTDVIFSRAKGLDLVSVAAVMQTNVTQLAVLASSDIQRPRDFDGKLYAGFGTPYEQPLIRTVIQADGGKGQFQTVVLNTSAYDALYNKKADFTEIFSLWEGIEADLRNIKLRTFQEQKYGVPDYPSVVLVASQANLVKRRAALQKFMDATRKGYEYAAQSPADAAKAFTDYLPKDTFAEADLVPRSAAMMAPVLLDKNGHWGVQDQAQWDAYAKWLVDQGIVQDGKGVTLKAVPTGPMFTNDLLQA